MARAANGPSVPFRSSLRRLTANTPPRSGSASRHIGPAAALALIHALTLELIRRRTGGPVAPMSRLVAVLFFGLNGLAVSQGDALRWYPLFALLIALFLWSYLRAPRPVVAIPLGLAFSTNFLALPVALCFSLWRYLVERRFDRGFELRFWGLFGFFGLLGFITAAAIIMRGPLAHAGTQFDEGMVNGLANTALGFFGGNSLGLGQAWAAVPAMLVFAAAAWTLADRRNPAEPVNLLLLLFVPPLAMAGLGFAKPRSFLYLAPVLSTVLTLYVDLLLARGKASLALAMSALVLCSAIGTVATLGGNDRPFKRNIAIPYDELTSFVGLNATTPVLVVTNDAVANYVLRRALLAPGDCVILAKGRRRWPCPVDPALYHTVVAIYAPTYGEAKPAGEPWDSLERRTPAAILRLGRDLDALLKSRLSGRPVPEFLLEVRLYR